MLSPILISAFFNCVSSFIFSLSATLSVFSLSSSCFVSFDTLSSFANLLSLRSAISLSFSPSAAITLFIFDCTLTSSADKDPLLSVSFNNWASKTWMFCCSSSTQLSFFSSVDRLSVRRLLTFSSSFFRNSFCSSLTTSFCFCSDTTTSIFSFSNWMFLPDFSSFDKLSSSWLLRSSSSFLKELFLSSTSPIFFLSSNTTNPCSSNCLFSASIDEFFSSRSICNISFCTDSCCKSSSSLLRAFFASSSCWSLFASLLLSSCSVNALFFNSTSLFAKSSFNEETSTVAVLSDVSTMERKSFNSDSLLSTHASKWPHFSRNSETCFLSSLVCSFSSVISLSLTDSNSLIVQRFWPSSSWLILNTSENCSNLFAKSVFFSCKVLFKLLSSSTLPSNPAFSSAVDLSSWISAVISWSFVSTTAASFSSFSVNDDTCSLRLSDCKQTLSDSSRWKFLVVSNDSDNSLNSFSLLSRAAEVCSSLASKESFSSFPLFTWSLVFASKSRITQSSSSNCPRVASVAMTASCVLWTIVSRCIHFSCSDAISFSFNAISSSSSASLSPFSFWRISSRNWHFSASSSSLRFKMSDNCSIFTAISSLFCSKSLQCILISSTLDRSPSFSLHTASKCSCTDSVAWSLTSTKALSFPSCSFATKTSPLSRSISLS